MGKYTLIGTSEPGIETTIPRSLLIEFVEDAIKASQQAAARDEQEPTPDYDALRTIARTTREIDAFTFKCTNSCGCPLTAAGAVRVIEPNGSLASDLVPFPYSEFARRFDQRVGAFVRNNRTDDVPRHLLEPNYVDEYDDDDDELPAIHARITED